MSAGTPPTTSARQTGGADIAPGTTSTIGTSPTNDTEHTASTDQRPGPTGRAASGEHRHAASADGRRSAPTASADSTGSAGTSTATPSTATMRLDAAIPARGLARSRTAAAALILAGRVTIDGVPVVKASTPVTASSHIVVDAEDEWVSRAALKLVGALDAFGVDPRGRTVLDVGASTGGFTQVLLARGASRVIALDVGHGQLAPAIAIDDRVAVVEGVNARNLTRDDYLALDPAAERTSLVVGDLSFISLRMVLPALVAAVPADEFVLLVKPQFEVGRTGIREGIVRSASLRQDALDERPLGRLGPGPRNGGRGGVPDRRDARQPRVPRASPARCRGEPDRMDPPGDGTGRGSAMSDERHILLVSHTGRRDSIDAAVEVCDILHDAGLTPVMPFDEYADIRRAEASVGQVDILGVDVRPDEIEIVIVLGGDGTILRAAELARGTKAPIVGVNLGHVGFLAESERDGLAETVERALTGEYKVEERVALQVDVVVGNEIVYSSWALNEATVEKASRERMLEVVTEVDGRPLSSFGCDGVVFSTPTGSTAYSFSGGGPVVWPDVDAILMVPLSAHALFSRPIVVGPDRVLAVEVLRRTSGVGVLWCDGRRTHDLPPGARVEVRRSPEPVRVARIKDAAFADRLVAKFRLPVAGWRGPAA